MKRRRRRKEEEEEEDDEDWHEFGQAAFGGDVGGSGGLTDARYELLGAGRRLPDYYMMEVVSGRRRVHQAVLKWKASPSPSADASPSPSAGGRHAAAAMMPRVERKRRQFKKPKHEQQGAFAPPAHSFHEDGNGGGDAVLEEFCDPGSFGVGSVGFKVEEGTQAGHHPLAVVVVVHRHLIRSRGVRSVACQLAPMSLCSTLALSEMAVAAAAAAAAAEV